MTKPVRLAREARDELHEAARRYGEVRPELRTDFLAAIDEAMVRLVRMARHLGSPPGIDPALGVRRVFVVAGTVSRRMPPSGNPAAPHAGGPASAEASGATSSASSPPYATAGCSQPDASAIRTSAKTGTTRCRGRGRISTTDSNHRATHNPAITRAFRSLLRCCAATQCSIALAAAGTRLFAHSIRTTARDSVISATGIVSDVGATCSAELSPSRPNT